MLLSEEMSVAPWPSSCECRRDRAISRPVYHPSVKTGISRFWNVWLTA